MSERSQIYVKYDGVLVAERHFSWCEERGLISRLYHTLKWMQRNEMLFQVSQEKFEDTLIRVLDTNFDTEEITISSSVEEVFEECIALSEIGPEVTYQDMALKKIGNDDGILLLSVEKGKAKYCFLDSGRDLSKPLSAKAFMRLAYGDDWKKRLKARTCTSNIAGIEERTTVMKPEDVLHFTVSNFGPQDDIPF